MQTALRIIVVIAMLFTFIWILANSLNAVYLIVTALDMAANGGDAFAVFEHFALATIQAFLAIGAAWIRGHLNRWRLRLSA